MTVLPAFSKLGNLARIAYELQSKFERILSRSVSELVDKTFHYKPAARVLDRPPPSARSARMRERVLDTKIRGDVRNRGARSEFSQPRIVRALLAPFGGDGSGSLEVLVGR